MVGTDKGLESNQLPCNTYVYTIPLYRATKHSHFYLQTFYRQSLSYSIYLSIFRFRAPRCARINRLIIRFSFEYCTMSRCSDPFGRRGLLFHMPSAIFRTPYVLFSNILSALHPGIPFPTQVNTHSSQHGRSIQPELCSSPHMHMYIPSRAWCQIETTQSLMLPVPPTTPHRPIYI